MPSGYLGFIIRVINNVHEGPSYNDYIHVKENGKIYYLMIRSESELPTGTLVKLYDKVRENNFQKWNLLSKPTYPKHNK